MNNDQNNAKLPSDAPHYNLTDFDYLVDATLSVADNTSAPSHPEKEQTQKEASSPADIIQDRSEHLSSAASLYTEYSGGVASEEDGESFPLPYATDMPTFFEKRHFILSPSYLFFALAYTVSLIAVAIALTVGICNIVSLHDKARPEAVIDEYLSLISENRLYRDILFDVQEHKSSYENDVLAADSVFERLVSNDDKQYMQVISDEDGLLRYDVFVGESRLYRLVLGKKAEASAFGLSFWDVLDASFYDNAVLSCMKTYRISAPADADVYLNGILVDKKHIIDQNYNFFIGSAWESETPEGARCVLYEIEGLFGEPTFTAKIDGETLGIYADDDGVYHAKFPTGWVRDYIISVPSGSVVHVNGILATAISEHGKAPSTAFESGDAGVTDVYRIEGLFNLPSVTVRFDGKALTEHTFENDTFTYAFTDDVYHKAEIIVPTGAVVSVNGVLLSDLNCVGTKLSVSEWASLPFVINSYTPTELSMTTSVAMPSFMKYTVSSLYMMPNVTVKVGDTEIPAARSEISTDGKGSTFAFDAPMIGSQSDIESFAIAFAKTYIKYVTEGCYGIRDDVELRKNFYKNWTEYLSYIVPDSLCFDSALDSYSDVEYRPIAQVISQSYSIQHSIRYSDDVRYCQITCTVQDSLDLEETTFIMNVLIVRQGKNFKIWMHDTLEA